MKVQARKLNDKERMVVLDTLYTAVGSVRGRGATKLLLRDLLTESERIMLGRRIIIARKLLAGNSYENIHTKMRVGMGTIARVHRWLHDTLPGYEKAIKGLEQEHRKRKRVYENRKSFAALKRKYPLHFLLFPWPRGFGPSEQDSRPVRK